MLGTKVIQERLQKILDRMEIGESCIFADSSGWKTKITKKEDGFDTKIYNPTNDGRDEKFFTVDTSINPYGAPMIIQEPTLSISCRDAGVNIDGNIVGALVVGNSGKIEERFSWTNIFFIKNLSFFLLKNEELLIDDEKKGFLNLLFLPDKNRMKGYVGVFTPKKPKEVRVVELEEIILEQLLK